DPYMAFEYARIMGWNNEHEAANTAYQSAEALGIHPLLLLPSRAEYFYDIGDYGGAVADYEQLAATEGAFFNGDQITAWAGSYLLLDNVEAAVGIVRDYRNATVNDWELD